MLLAINVGNTNTTFAVFDGKDIAADWRIQTAARRTEDECSVLIGSLCERDGLDVDLIDGVAIACVVPTAVFPLLRYSQLRLHVGDPLVLNGENAGIEVHYGSRSSVGADRIANAIALHEMYGGPGIAIDFGTATTFDAIDASGAYLGGAIAPGIETSVEALASRTAQLRRVEFVKPPYAIATSTVENLQSGIIYGFAGQVDGIVGRFRAELGGDARVVATGGLANVIASESASIEIVDKMLTLHGLRIAYERRQAAG